MWNQNQGTIFGKRTQELGYSEMAVPGLWTGRNTDRFLSIAQYHTGGPLIPSKFILEYDSNHKELATSKTTNSSMAEAMAPTQT